MNGGHMKRCSASLTFEETWTKATMRLSPHIRQNGYHQKRQQIANAVNSLLHVCYSGNVNWGSHCGKEWTCLKNLNKITIWSGSSTPGYLSKENEHTKPTQYCKVKNKVTKKKKKDKWAPLFTAAVLTVVKTQKHPKCLSTDEWIKKVWCIYKYTHTYTMKAHSATKRMKSCHLQQDGWT